MDEIINTEHLTQYVNRLERLEKQKQELIEDTKVVYGEIKSSGFDIKAVKQVIKLRKMDKTKLAEQEAILELYREALGI